MERTLVILKPDAVERKLVGEITSRFERRNFTISQIKMLRISRELAEIHYAHVKAISIYEDMMQYITSGPVVAFIMEGDRIIQSVRSMIGKTSCYDSPAGTIRGDFGMHRFQNLIHASDSPENAETEIARFFPENKYAMNGETSANDGLRGFQERSTYLDNNRFELLQGKADEAKN
jgi:nucleoside-diphosphate kinase